VRGVPTGINLRDFAINLPVGQHDPVLIQSLRYEIGGFSEVTPEGQGVACSGRAPDA
jgi:hypothetical protein